MYRFQSPVQSFPQLPAGQEGPALTVIVPVYHVERYLTRCLDSLRKQTFRDFEALIVFDGGNEEEKEIAERFCQEDSRFRLLCQENRGLSAARNHGIREAKGKWLYFLDSDDWLEEDCFEKILEAGEKEDADIVLFGFYLNFPVPALDFVHQKEVPSFTDPKDALKALLEGKVVPNVWAKLFRRGMFREIFFPEGELWEDVATMHELFYRARKITSISYAGYHYYQHPESITKKDPQQVRYWRYRQLRRRQRFLRENCPEMTPYMQKQWTDTAFGYAVYCAVAGDREGYRQLRKDLREFPPDRQRMKRSERILLEGIVHAYPLFALAARLRERKRKAAGIG
ncbi:MAG: glycosyltransferase family 2 protein [Erysipelotrichaceae bacterium]|nr:glycosyltransferase family 2 protein [Erysipelotrichaceae bacterium]